MLIRSNVPPESRNVTFGLQCVTVSAVPPVMVIVPTESGVLSMIQWKLPLSTVKSPFQSLRYWT